MLKIVAIKNSDNKIVNVTYYNIYRFIIRPSTRQYSFSSFKNKPSLKANSVSNDLPSSRHRTRAEIAHLEAIESFGGSNLDDVLGGAKKKVSRTLESSNKKKKQ